MNQRSHILYEQLKGFVQRMDMNVVKKDLPPKTVFVIAVKLSPMQRLLYKRFLDVHGLTQEKASSEKNRNNFFAGYQALSQVLTFMIHKWVLSFEPVWLSMGRFNAYVCISLSSNRYNKNNLCNRRLGLSSISKD